MGRAEQESTARIRRETLTGLLDTMAPTELQPITARVRISDIQAEAARDLAVTLLAVPLQSPPPVTPPHDEVTKIIDVSKILEALNAVEESKAAKVARLAAELEQLDGAAAQPVAVVRSTKERVARLIEELKEIEATQPFIAPTISRAERVTRLVEELKAIEVAPPAAASKSVETSQAERVTRLVEELKAIEAAQPLAASKSVETSQAERVTRLVEELKAIEAAPTLAASLSQADRVTRLIKELQEIEAAPTLAASKSLEHIESSKLVAMSNADRVTRLIEELNEIAAAPALARSKSVDSSEHVESSKFVAMSNADRVTRLIEELKAIASAEPVVAPRSIAAAKLVEALNFVEVPKDDTILGETRTKVGETRTNLGETRTNVGDTPTHIDGSEHASDQRLFSDVDWDEILGAAVSAMIAPPSLLVQPSSPRAHERAKRPSKAPFAHIAAMLPRTPMPMRAQKRAKTNNDAGLPSAEQKAVQLIADVREKLETAAQLDAMAERPSFPTLSPRVAAELSGEEIAMLPMEVRLMLPEVAFPRIAMTPLPGPDLCIAIHSTPCRELGHAIRVSETTSLEPAPVWPVLTLVAYFTAACLAGFGAVYCLA
jgi:hypothetical protein